MIQTIDEVRRMADDWGRNFAPADMLQNEKNAQLLVDYCLAQFGVVTVGGLTHAYNALRAKLDLVPAPPAPKVKTADELAAEENMGMHRDYLRSVAPQESFEAKVARDKQKRLAAEAVKAQTDAKGELAVAIAGYQCYRLNGAGIDYTATEIMQTELRGVRFGNGKDFVRTLAVVRQIIQELPDHPKMGDVARVVESLNARLK
jgi:hypothetical protein